MLTSISVTVIAAFVVIFVLALIPVLFQVRRTAKEAEKLLETVRLQIAPVAHDVVRVVDDVRDIVKQAQRQMDKVEESVDAVRDTVVKLRDVESLLRDRVEKPLLGIIGTIGALVKGVRIFIDHIRR
ncbi:MAG: DUF948 domain-containing protein [candidate division KSB1 bacterium]|nr:DUF948 domain-containing protein [candidate division KSB1 bacterium]MDZ7337657.1 DUF948 domain-containing protein [candidate division KSB1 bacterium]MDZ7385666.1 DUF948 domain-containing protein [candidate division KSB1 bacterium]MDZ7393607.1 DUF948 domain-containing protein [candidate division KSB1 bacterium]